MRLGEFFYWCTDTAGSLIIWYECKISGGLCMDMYMEEVEIKNRGKKEKNGKFMKWIMNTQFCIAHKMFYIWSIIELLYKFQDLSDYLLLLYTIFFFFLLFLISWNKWFYIFAWQYTVLLGNYKQMLELNQHRNNYKNVHWYKYIKIVDSRYKNRYIN